MTQGELVTKDDLERMKAEILAAIRSQIKPAKKKVLTFDEARERLGGMKPGTLRCKCSQGEIAFIKVGKYTCFFEEDIDFYLVSNRCKSNAELRSI